MNEVITLIGAAGKRDVFCAIRSVGQTEFYAAYASDLQPEKKFVLADYLDHEGEIYIEHDGTLYRVLRTFRKGQELEITVGKASAEEVAEAYGENH